MTVENINQKECKPCKEGGEPLKGKALDELKNEIHKDWKIVEQQHLEREFKIKDYEAVLNFTQQVGEIANEQNHHPDIYLTYGKVRIKLWSHKVGGLTENDFILASKIDQINSK